MYFSKYLFSPFKFVSLQQALDVIKLFMFVILTCNVNEKWFLTVLAKVWENNTFQDWTNFFVEIRLGELYEI